MGTKYSSTLPTGYNSNPPADDGSQVASNKVKYSTIKSKLADPLNTYASSLDTALQAAFDTSSSITSVDYTTVASDHLKPIEVSGTTTISLGDAATMGSGYQPTIVNVGTDPVTIALATNTDTLNGTTNGSVTLAPNASTTFTVNNGANGYESIARVAKFATQVKQQVFTASGTYTPTTGMIYAIVKAVGGGGAGGGSSASFYGGGGGGGGGETAEKVLSSSSIGTSQTVTIGAGGTTTVAGAGGAGGDTSLGTLVVAKGGTGGSNGNASAAAASGGGGGTGGTGDVLIPGESGGVGIGAASNVCQGGNGGSSTMGFGASLNCSASTITSSTGAGGAGYGSGGSGAVQVNSGSTFAGGAGNAGILVITELVAASS